LKKFVLLAFLPAVFAGWAITEPGRYRGSEGLGASVGFIGIGLLAFFIAKRNGSHRPATWAGLIMTASVGLALLGRSQ
jgi:hypothetical protein